MCLGCILASSGQNVCGLLSSAREWSLTQVQPSPRNWFWGWSDEEDRSCVRVCSRRRSDLDYCYTATDAQTAQWSFSHSVAKLAELVSLVSRDQRNEGRIQMPMVHARILAWRLTTFIVTGRMVRRIPQGLLRCEVEPPRIRLDPQHPPTPRRVKWQKWSCFLPIDEPRIRPWDQLCLRLVVGCQTFKQTWN